MGKEEARRAHKLTAADRRDETAQGAGHGYFLPR